MPAARMSPKLGGLAAIPRRSARVAKRNRQLQPAAVPPISRLWSRAVEDGADLQVRQSLKPTCSTVLN